MFIKTCKSCGKEVAYEDASELREWFYWKKNCYQGVCKDCDREDHAKKYASGKYNYRKKRQSDGIPEYSFGNNLRCWC